MLNLQRTVHVTSLLLFVLLLALSNPALLQARDDDRDRDRVRFYGWVDSMPSGFHGTWIISGRQVTTSPRTEFDQEEGPLRPGACAKVDIRGGRVHEIDSEPARNCQ